jgi:hypothetical protein
LRSCPEQAFVETAVGYLDGLSRPGPHRYAAVETSNLWPNIFEETCSELGLSSSYIEPHRLNLKSLVSRRNDIAHGKDVGVSDKDLYKLETSAWAMMLALAEEVATAVHQKKYLHQGSLLAQ